MVRINIKLLRFNSLLSLLNYRVPTVQELNRRLSTRLSSVLLSTHRTELTFGEHARLVTLFMPFEYQVIRFSRLGALNRGFAPYRAPLAHSEPHLASVVPELTARQLEQLNIEHGERSVNFMPR